MGQAFSRSATSDDAPLPGEHRPMQQQNAQDHRRCAEMLNNATASMCAGSLAVSHNPIFAAPAGYVFGQHLAQGDVQNPMLVGTKRGLHKMCEAVWAAEDAGYLKHYRICGVPCLGVAGLSKFFETYEDFQPEPEPQPQAWPQPERRGFPIVYPTKMEREGRQFRIHQSQVTAFLLDNQIPVMVSAELVKHLGRELAKVLPVLHCRCIGKYSIQGQTQVATLGQDHSQGLRPGDSKFEIRIDEEFHEYAKDPSKYEDKLKRSILKALGLDAVNISGVERHIKIVQVKQGSVMAWVAIGLVVFAVATFATYYGHTSRPRSNCATPTPPPRATYVLVPSPALPPAPPVIRRQVSDISLSASSDGSFELVGHVSPARKCYLGKTLFQTDFDEYIEARELKVNSDVLGISGQKIRIMSKMVHGRCRRDLVTMHTSQGILTVPADHRVAIEGPNGVATEEDAAMLQQGMFVFCGRRRHQLTRVMEWQRDVEAGSFC